MTTPLTTPRTPTAVAAEAERTLTAAALARQVQLDGLPPAKDDPVVAAQRAGLEQTLRDIAGARRRLADGTYGSCTDCGTDIAPERLTLRPWSDVCVPCAQR